MPLFISYSHRDREFVENLAKQLVAHHVNIWLDRWELNIGDSLLERIQQAIEGATALLVILSKNSVASDWCKKELGGGLMKELEEKRVFVLPVLLEDCDVPLFLRDKLYADFRTSFDDGLRTILEGVAKYTNPYLARHKGADFHTDYGIDWKMADGILTIRLVYVEQAENQPYTVLTAIVIRASPGASALHKKLRDNKDEDQANLHVIKTLLQDMEKQPDLRPLLTDQFEQTAARVVKGAVAGEEYFAVFSTRRLGEETGRDILVNTTNLLRDTAKRMEGVLHRPDEGPHNAR